MSGPAAPAISERRALSPLRRIAIDNLCASRDTAVPVSLFTEADAEPLLAALARRRGAGTGPRTTFAVLGAKLVVAALLDHPDVNSGLDGAELVRYAGVHLGLAVALPDGQLTVVVVHEAQRHDLAALAAVLGDLRARALTSRLGLAEVRGGVVTLSSVGSAPPGLTAAPTLPAGHTAIVFLGVARDAAVVREDRVTIGKRLPVSLTFDHRVVNGVPAVAFLADLVRRIEDPEPWL